MPMFGVKTQLTRWQFDKACRHFICAIIKWQPKSYASTNRHPYDCPLAVIGNIWTVGSFNAWNNNLQRLWTRLLFKNGVSAKVIQERLGQSSVAFTMNTYAHVSPGMQKQVANQFDDAVIPDKSNSRALPTSNNDKWCCFDTGNN